MNARSQRGEGKLAAIFWLLVLAIGGMIAWQTIPVKMRMSKLEDFITESTQHAGFGNGEAIKKAILRKAESLQLPLDEKHLDVQLGRNNIYIKGSYTVLLEFPGYTYHWDKEIEMTRPVFHW